MVVSDKNNNNLVLSQHLRIGIHLPLLLGGGATALPCRRGLCWHRAKKTEAGTIVHFRVKKRLQDFS